MFGLLFVIQAATATTPTPIDVDLQRIRAFVPVSDSLATAGQMTYEQVETLAAANFDLIINLAPLVPERNGREEEVVTQHGMKYVHIPVPWNAPQLTHLETFFTTMRENTGKKILVHCQANMRASAFVYLYRVLELGVDESAARPPMAGIWDPASVEAWGRLVDTARKEWSKH